MMNLDGLRSSFDEKGGDIVVVVLVLFDFARWQQQNKKAREFDCNESARSYAALYLDLTQSE